MQERRLCSLVRVSALIIALAMLPTMAWAQDRIVGLWLYTITSSDNSFSPFQLLTTFNQEGTIVSDASIDLNPQTLSSPTHGVWWSIGHQAVHIKELAFSYDSSANPNGMYIIDQTDTVSRDGGSITGVCNFKIIDNNGVTIFGPAACTTSATRVTP